MGIPVHRNTIIGSTVGHIIVIAWLVFLWTSFLWMGLPMISCSYFVHGMTGFPMNIIHMNRSLYDQLFLYLVMAYLVFLWTALPISAFLCLRSYIYTWHKWSSYICSSHHWFSYERPSYHCVPIFAFLWLRLPISMSSCGKGWLQYDIKVHLLEILFENPD